MLDIESVCLRRSSAEDDKDLFSKILHKFADPDRDVRRIRLKLGPSLGDVCPELLGLFAEGWDMFCTFTLQNFFRRYALFC